MLKMLPADDADDMAIDGLRAQIKEAHQSHNKINQALTLKIQFSRFKVAAWIGRVRAAAFSDPG